MFGSIDVKKLNELHQKGEKPEVIDVRTPAEFREVHITFAKNMPLESLDPKGLAAQRNGAGNQPLYVVCRSGNRSKMACEKLCSAGVQVINVEGGTMAWAGAGYAVNRGKKAVSLERQVRIVAGTLVLTGVILGTWVTPYLYGLSAFVGAGLIFAGVTDTCPMAMMIAKMPWNQVKSDASSATCQAS